MAHIPTIPTLNKATTPALNVPKLPTHGDVPRAKTPSTVPGIPSVEEIQKANTTPAERPTIDEAQTEPAPVMRPLPAVVDAPKKQPTTVVPAMATIVRDTAPAQAAVLPDLEVEAAPRNVYQFSSGKNALGLPPAARKAPKMQLVQPKVEIVQEPIYILKINPMGEDGQIVEEAKMEYRGPMTDEQFDGFLYGMVEMFDTGADDVVDIYKVAEHEEQIVFGDGVPLINAESYLARGADEPFDPESNTMRYAVALQRMGWVQFDTPQFLQGFLSAMQWYGGEHENYIVEGSLMEDHQPVTME